MQTQADAQLLPASKQTLAKWNCPDLKSLALTGPQPWAATELEDCDALSAASLEWLQVHWGNTP